MEIFGNEMFEELVVFQRLSKFLSVTQLAAQSVQGFSCSCLIFLQLLRWVVLSVVVVMVNPSHSSVSSAKYRVKSA